MKIKLKMFKLQKRIFISLNQTFIETSLQLTVLEGIYFKINYHDSIIYCRPNSYFVDSDSSQEKTPQKRRSFAYIESSPEKSPITKQQYAPLPYMTTPPIPSSLPPQKSSTVIPSTSTMRSPAKRPCLQAVTPDTPKTGKSITGI